MRTRRNCIPVCNLLLRSCRILLLLHHRAVPRHRLSFPYPLCILPKLDLDVVILLLELLAVRYLSGFIPTFPHGGR